MHSLIPLFPMNKTYLLFYSVMLLANATTCEASLRKHSLRRKGKEREDTVIKQATKRSDSVHERCGIGILEGKSDSLYFLRLASTFYFLMSRPFFRMKAEKAIASPALPGDGTETLAFV